MKQAHIESEWQAINTLVCGQDDALKGELLGRLRSGHFGLELTNPLFLRVAELAGQLGAVPSYETLAALPGVSAVSLQSLATFATSRQPLRTLEDAKALVAVLDYYRRGRLLVANSNLTLSELANEAPDMEKIKLSTEKVMLDLDTAEDEAKLWTFGTESNSAELVARVLSPEGVPRIKTGFRDFDAISSGYRLGNFVGMASHYKGGKSFVALNMARRQASLGYRVLFIPMEMNDEETTERLLSMLSGVEYKKIGNKTCSTSEIAQISKAWRQFEAEQQSSGGKLSIHALPSLTPLELRTRYKAFKYQVIYLDYLKLMEPTDKAGDGNEALRLDTIGRELKPAASDMQAVIVGLAQLDEKTEDLRYSKALKEHCNNVWKWKYLEAQRAAGVIEVEQMCARSWDPLPFKLKVDFAYARVDDVPTGDESMMAWNNEISMEGMFDVR